MTLEEILLMNKLTSIFSVIAMITAAISLAVSASTASYASTNSDQDWEVRYLRCNYQNGASPFTVQIHEHYIHWDRVRMDYFINDLLLTGYDGSGRSIYIDQISGDWSDTSGKNYTGTCKKAEPLF